MSDGMTDVARDQRRAKATEQWLNALAEALTSPSEEADQAVADCATAVEEIRRGYWEGQRHGFSAHSAKVLSGLKSGDVEAWTNFLGRLEGPHYELFDNIRAAQ